MGEFCFSRRKLKLHRFSTVPVAGTLLWFAGRRSCCVSCSVATCVLSQGEQMFATYRIFLVRNSNTYPCDGDFGTFTMKTCEFVQLVYVCLSICPSEFNNPRALTNVLLSNCTLDTCIIYSSPTQPNC